MPHNDDKTYVELLLRTLTFYVSVLSDGDIKDDVREEFSRKAIEDINLIRELLEQPS